MPEAEPITEEKLPGLTSAEAEALYKEGQENAVIFQTHRNAREFFFDTLLSVFNFDLLGIGLALWLLGRPEDALISILVLLLNISISTTIGYRNWKQMERLLALTESKASVFRDDQIKAIDPDRIVPGDAVLIAPGDQFFADGKLTGDSSLRIDDTIVSGNDTFVSVSGGDLVFAGSYCVSGHGVYEVTAVGSDRRLNSVWQKGELSSKQRTPLQALILKILRILRILVISFVVVLLVRFFLTPEMTDDRYDLYIDAISMIFSIAPSGMLFMILVTYASGAAQIGPLGAIIRRPETVEALAQTEVLCLGRTGTLMGGDAELQSLAVDQADAAVSETRRRQMVGSFARSAALTTPLMQVLIDSFPGVRLEPTSEAPVLPVLGWQAMTFEEPEARGTYVLGFERFVTPLLDPQKVPALSEDSHDNPLLFAYSPRVMNLFSNPRQISAPNGLLPLARVFLNEVVREDTIATVQAFLDAGIGVKILSSDTVDAVTAAAERAGIMPVDSEGVAALSGRELMKIEPEDLYGRIRETDLYGRLAPHQKEIIVQTLRDNGTQVAMVGETVIDVPAMRAAGIGITMRSSNQAALNEADMILLEDSLQNLPRILELGQGVFNRLLDALKLSLTHALVVCWLALIAFVAGPFYFPYFRAQNLPVVLFTITFPSILLSFWLVSGKIESENLTRRLFFFVLPASLTMTLLFMAVFLYFENGTSSTYARTAVAHTMVLSGLILIIFVQPPTDFWAGGDSVSGDRRPTQLVIILYLIFLVMAQNLTVRPNSFGIGPLRSFNDFFLVWAFTAVWVLALRGLWRSSFVRRLAQFSLEPVGDVLENDNGDDAPG
jgi:cation-transporting ATPase E